MKKTFCEISLDCEDGKKRTYKCAGKTKGEAVKKLLQSFPGAKIVQIEVLHEYDERDYGWV